MHQWNLKLLVVAAGAALAVMACDGGDKNAVVPDGATDSTTGDTDAKTDVTVTDVVVDRDNTTNPDDTTDPDVTKLDGVADADGVTNPDTTTDVGPNPACAGKQCGTAPDGSSCGSCGAGQICNVLGQCRVPSLAEGSYCGVTVGCTPKIPDPAKPDTMIDNPKWPACAHGQCDSNLCGSLGQQGAFIDSVPVCTRACIITKDSVDNTTGAASPDGVEDTDTPLNECAGFSNGPNGSDYRCVNFGFGTNQSGLSFCVPTLGFDACQGNNDCPAGESCQLAVMGSSFTQRCVATLQPGPWFQVSSISEECNEDPLAGDPIKCDAGLCFGLGCVPFCKDDADCDTTVLSDAAGCDTVAGTCKGWAEKSCTTDVECSAWTCDPDRTPYGPNVGFTTSLCWPRGCDKSVDCAPGNYCQWGWNGKPGLDAGLDNLCLEETPGGKALGEPCETDDDCAGYCEADYCSTICDTDDDCDTSKGQLCALDELLGDASGDDLADFVLVVPQCHTFPGDGGPCLSISDCGDEEVCALYEIPNYLPDTTTPDPDGPVTTAGKCIAADAAKGQWGDLCGTSASADFKACQTGICRNASADGSLGFCTHSCSSAADCPAVTFQAGTAQAQSFSGICTSSAYGYAGNLDDPTRWTRRSTCAIGNPNSSLTDCSETLTCDESGEACLPFAISFGPEHQAKIEYLCDDLKNEAGVAPTKTIGQACDPDAVDAAGDPIEECVSGLCLTDELANTSYCSAMCKPDTDTTCAAAGLICSPRVTQPKAGKYVEKQASFGVCTKDQNCEPCVSSGFCPAGRVCANLGQDGASLADFRCIPSCETAADCADAPSKVCSPSADEFGAPAKACFELKAGVPVDYCLGN